MEAGGSRTDGEAFQKERRSRGREGGEQTSLHTPEGRTHVCPDFKGPECRTEKKSN